jgi:hypothetical protein
MCTVLNEGLTVEEIYDLLIFAYIEFEEEQLKIAVQSYVQWGEYPEIVKDRLSLNLRLLTFLSACRLYFDQIVHHLKKISSVTTLDITSIEKLRTKYYDQHIEYRFMEELRNHVQHRGLPIHLFSYSSHIVGEDIQSDDKMMAFSTEFAAEAGKLKEAGKFKPKILDDIDEKIDLKMASRVYMACIGQVHAKVRDEISSILAVAREYVNKLRDLYKKEVDSDLLGLGVESVSEDGQRKMDFYISLKWDDVRITLEDKNRVRKKLASFFATGALKTAHKSQI